jgi:hypothetical protein
MRSLILAIVFAFLAGCGNIDGEVVAKQKVSSYLDKSPNYIPIGVINPQVNGKQIHPDRYYLSIKNNGKLLVVEVAKGEYDSAIVGQAPKWRE